MMRIPIAMEGRYVSVLMPGLPTANIRITRITTDEIVGRYDDNDEVHISQDKLFAWWPDTRKERVHEARVIVGSKGARVRAQNKQRIDDVPNKAIITLGGTK